MEGKANDQEIFDFLTLLSEKGESSDEIAGGVYILREKSKRVNVDNCIDTCDSRSQAGDRWVLPTVPVLSDCLYLVLTFLLRYKLLERL